jgi:Uma2 family endonuclease
MRYRREATLDDLTLMAEGWRAEIVHGKLEPLPMGCTRTARAGDYITTALSRYEQRTESGVAAGDKTIFEVKMRFRECFIPDSSYCLGVNAETLDRVGPPSLAVEIRSDTEYDLRAERGIEFKRKEYFEAGTLIVWDVDVLREGFIKSYHKDAPDEPTVFKRGDLAHAEPTLPGFRLDVEDMIEYAHARRHHLP